MRHLARAGHIPAIPVVAGAANRAYTHTTRVVHYNLFQTVWTAVLNHTGKIYVVSLDTLAAGERLGILRAHLHFTVGTRRGTSWSAVSNFCTALQDIPGG